MTTRDTALPSELSRDLALFHVTMMGLGMMIGAGVFLGIGNAIHKAGPGGVLLTFALEVAGILAEDDESEITAFTVGRRFDLDAFLRRYTRRDASSVGRRIATKTARPRGSPGAGEVVEAILDEAEGHDLIVIGSTGRRPLSSFMRATVPEAVAQRTTKPLAMVKAGGGIASWIGRWI